MLVHHNSGCKDGNAEGAISRHRTKSDHIVAGLEVISSIQLAFASTEHRLEVHIPDLGDLYRQSLRVEFIRRLWSDVRLTSVEALTSQFDTKSRLSKGGRYASTHRVA